MPHPGEGLRGKLEELHMSPKEFAVRCNKPIKTISEVLNGKSAITPDYARRFGTHPAMIVGRLQHRGVLGHSEGAGFRVRIDWGGVLWVRVKALLGRGSQPSLVFPVEHWCAVSA
ncbi:MAG: hypothetical protein H6559_20830 [Lewinellaceae bacterium]|nr:hypothetical protein [Lewinellaceae bacterium]